MFKYDDNVETLVNFCNSVLMDDAKKKLPLTHGLVTSASRKASSKKSFDQRSAKEALALSALLTTWVSKSVFAYRNNVLLTSGGCKGEEMDCFHRLGICSHQNTLQNLQTKFGETFDKPVVQWKTQLEDNKLQTLLFREVVDKQLGHSGDDSMDKCTVDFSKSTVSTYGSFSDHIYEKCLSHLPLSDSLVYDDQDIFDAMDKLQLANCRFRYCEFYLQFAYFYYM